MAIWASNGSSGAASTRRAASAGARSRRSFAGQTKVASTPAEFHQRQVADELNRIAEAMIVEDQHAVLSAPRSFPGRIARAQRLGERLALQPASLVALESALEIPERQQQATLAGDRLVGAERLGRLEGRERLAVAAEVAQDQRLAA